MIRPIAPTHKAAIIKAARIKQSQETLKAAERHTIKENLAFGTVFLVVATGAILLGKLISIIVRSLI